MKFQSTYLTNKVKARGDRPQNMTNNISPFHSLRFLSFCQYHLLYRKIKMLYPLTFKTELGSRIQFFQPSSTCALRVKAGRNGAIDSQNRTITHTVMSQLFIYISFCCKNEMKLRLTISLQYCAAYAACA